MSERVAPYCCPYCADEDLRPLGATAGHWYCRSCLRGFSIRFLGIQPHVPHPVSTAQAGGST
ncbi:MAG: hypothetical protein WCF04_06350 [Candidatus Nanopelagicales bacterium]